MQSKLLLLWLLTAACTATANAVTLPDACGDDKVKFEVSTQKTSAAATSPAEDKARIVFVEMSTKSGRWVPFGASTDFVIRLGLDGSWAGAVGNKSYFAVDITPGEHHLCSSVQGKKDMIGVASLTAEPGKTYYYQFEIKNTLDGQGFSHYAYALSKLDDDEGKFRVKALDVATPTPKH